MNDLELPIDTRPIDDLRGLVPLSSQASFGNMTPLISDEELTALVIASDLFQDWESDLAFEAESDPESDQETKTADNVRVRRKCRKCGGRGHFMKTCSKRRYGNIYLSTCESADSSIVSFYLSPSIHHFADNLITNSKI